MSQGNKPLITIVGALSKQARSAAHTLLQSGPIAYAPLPAESTPLTRKAWRGKARSS